MQPMLLWKRVVGYHALPVPHEDPGGFGIELLVSKGASVINCWSGWHKDLVNNRLQPNLASPILVCSKLGASAFARMS